MHLSEIRQMQEQILQKMAGDRQKSQIVEEDDKDDDEAAPSSKASDSQSRQAERRPPANVNIRTKKGVKKGPAPQSKRVGDTYKGKVAKPDDPKDELAILKAELEKEKLEKQRLAQ